MKRAARVALGLGLTAAAVLGPAVAVLAEGSGTATVRPGVEAWYRSCAVAMACAPLAGAPSPYAPDTLHVGVNLGQEEARTFVQLDLSTVPAGAQVSGGRLLLPVASGDGDGTRAPATAGLRACGVRQTVVEADGAFTVPPAVDCDAASAPAVFVAAAGDEPAAFTVDLAALTRGWRQGLQAGAVGLVPAEEVAASDTWHVAFSDRSRTGEGVRPIRAALTLVPPAVDVDSARPPQAEAPTAEQVPAVEPAPAPAAVTSLPEVDGQPAAALPLVGVEAPVAPPVVEPAPQTPVGDVPAQALPAVPTSVGDGFRHPAVFLLPLLFVAGTAWAGQTLTRDLL